MTKAKLAQRVTELFSELYTPMLTKPFSIDDIDISPDAERIIFSGVSYTHLAGGTQHQLYAFNSATKSVRPFADTGPHNGMARQSPDGRHTLLVSMRNGILEPFCFRENSIGDPAPLPDTGGLVEDIKWSSGGKKALLRIAETGASFAGSAGSKSIRDAGNQTNWQPEILSSDMPKGWRRAKVWDPKTNTIEDSSPQGLSVWESCWMGEEAQAHLVGETPEEKSWYGSKIIRWERSGATTVLHESEFQKGLLCGSPNGENLAFVEAYSSDRGVVCGMVRLLDPSGRVTTLDCDSVDVSDLTWIDNERLMFCGVREFETVAGEYNVSTKTASIHYASENLHAGFYYPSARPHPAGGVILSIQGFATKARLVHAFNGQIETLYTVEDEGVDKIDGLIDQIEPISWESRDGLVIQGWFLTPSSAAPPYSVVMEIHGGPVWLWRPIQLTHMPLIAALLSEGFSVFLPNPRGSTGRGQEFSSRVCGDMGGKDTLDYIDGIDYLISSGRVDPDRIFATGSSYGGYMSAWLATQSDIFAAVAPRCPVINWTTQHWTSNIADFDDQFLGGTAFDAKGPHFDRSPVNFAKSVRCPVLTIAGGMDECTPPTQAEEFHYALSDSNVRSELLIYPEEGHGFRDMNARKDVAIEIIDWFSGFSLHK